MDRVNRTLLVVSSLLAIPAALLMSPPSHGQSSGAQQTVGRADRQAHSVRQVAGTQPVERKSSDHQTKPGLLQVLIGSSNKGSENHQHQNMSTSQSRGLFSSLFSRSSGGSGQHSRQTHSAQHAQSSPTSNAAQTSNPDWSGVPYHGTDVASRSTNTPLRDPGSTSQAASAADARIIRGGSSRSVPAVTVSTRLPGRQTTTARSESAIAVPVPPREEFRPDTARQQVESLSPASSSRRVSRKEIDAMSAPEYAPRTRSSVSSAPDHDEVVDLVPKSRAVEAKPSQAEKTLESTPNPTGKQVANAPKPIESDPQIAPAPVATTKRPTIEPPAASPATVASARSANVPSRSREVPPSQHVTPYATPDDTDAKPIASAGVPSPVSDAPVSDASVSDASESNLPEGDDVVSMKANPGNSGIPAFTASHRSGPPAQAFELDEIEGSVAGEDSVPSTDQIPVNAASSPVGSGVVANGGVASYRRPASAADEPAADGFEGANVGTNGNRIPAPAQAPALQTPALTADNFSKTQAASRGPAPTEPFAAAIDGSTSTSELPGIRVTTLGPGAITIRQTSQYEIRVENRGSIDATGVMIRALVPDWADVRGRNATRGDIDNQQQGSSERLVWTIDQLAAGASETMIVRLQAARSGTFGLDVDWTLLPQRSTATVQVREPRLDLTIEGPEEVVFGQSQTYKVRVLNPGDGTAPNVVFTLSPNSATPQTQQIGDIPPGKEAQFDVELTAQDLGDLKIHGLASGELELRAESEKTIRVAAAKLEAVLSGPEVKYQNTEAMYGLQIQNNGSATSERIAVSLRIPSGVQYLGGIDGATQEGATLRWEITALAPAASRDYQFRCNMSSTGEHLFALDCKGSAAGSADVTINTRVESIADLVLTVSDPAAPAPIGTDVTYEIVIRNRGSKEATDIRTIAQFSHGIEPQRVEGQSGEVMTGQVLFDSIPRIGPGQEVRLKVTAQADRPGHHRFRTEVRSGDTVLVAEEATHYMSPKGDRVSRRSSETSTR